MLQPVTPLWTRSPASIKGKLRLPPELNETAHHSVETASLGLCGPVVLSVFRSTRRSVQR